MARGGYKFFDTDAHVGPYVDVLDPYLTADDKAAARGLVAIQGHQQKRPRLLQQGPTQISAAALFGDRGGGARRLHGGFHRREA